MESGLHKDSLDGSFDVSYVFHLESLFLGMVRVAVSHQTLYPKKLGTKKSQKLGQNNSQHFVAATCPTKRANIFVARIYPAIFLFPKISLQSSVLSQGSPLAFPATSGAAGTFATGALRNRAVAIFRGIFCFGSFTPRLVGKMIQWNEIDE